MSAAVYATIDDVQTLGRKLTADEQAKAEALITAAAAQLRLAVGRYSDVSLDIMIADNPDVAEVAKTITVKAIIRALDSSGAAVSQESQSALGYSLSMSYLNAGQDIYFLNNELKQLGLMRQKVGTLEVYGT